MHIRQAKTQIKNAVIAYNTKDKTGRYMIPARNQRPVFLIGAPGIGKTAIVEQIAQELGIRVKVNAVSLNLGEENLRGLLDIARKYPVDVRFIEMMPIGFGKNYESVNHNVLSKKLEEMFPGMIIDERPHGFGPAVYYKIPGYRGSVGLISAIHGKFCGTCNRVRLTSQGYLKTCLCYNDGADLREVLRSSLPEEEMRVVLRGRIEEVVLRKPGEHCFDKPQNITEEAGMNAIGG